MPWLSLLYSFLSLFFFFPKQFMPLTNTGKKRLPPSLCVFLGSYYAFFLGFMPLCKKKGFRGTSRRPWVPNQFLPEINRQHHSGIQSVILLFQTSSFDRLRALLCSSVQGSNSLQVLINFKRKRCNFRVGRPSGICWVSTT